MTDKRYFCVEINVAFTTPLIICTSVFQECVLIFTKIKHVIDAYLTYFIYKAVGYVDAIRFWKKFANGSKPMGFLNASERYKCPYICGMVHQGTIGKIPTLSRRWRNLLFVHYQSTQSSPSCWGFPALIRYNLSRFRKLTMNRHHFVGLRIK